MTPPALSGVGGAASNAAVGADAAAATNGSDAGGEGAWCPPCIDRLSGYDALSMDELFGE